MGQVPLPNHHFLEISVHACPVAVSGLVRPPSDLTPIGVKIGPDRDLRPVLWSKNRRKTSAKNARPVKGPNPPDFHRKNRSAMGGTTARAAGFDSNWCQIEICPQLETFRAGKFESVARTRQTDKPGHSPDSQRRGPDAPDSPDSPDRSSDNLQLDIRAALTNTPGQPGHGDGELGAFRQE